MATHAYSQAGSFTYMLTVTDNDSATGQTSGQITVTSPNRLTVQPASGTVQPGATATITVSFDAQGLADGQYQGQVNISSNGGSQSIALTLLR